MSDLVAIVYPDEGTAAEVRQAVARLQKEHLIEVVDAVAVVKHQDGRVELDQSLPLTAVGAAGGAARGGLWGTLIGLLFFAPLFGFAIGALAGGLGGAISGKLSDIGIDDEMMKQLGAQFQPGTSALFVLVTKVTPDKVLDEVKQYGGTVLKTSLTREQEAQLQSALSGQDAQ
jgi:uncharacterized membrane protein